MKKHITHAALLLCTVLTVAASCSKEAAGEAPAQRRHGCARNAAFRPRGPKPTRNTTPCNDHLAARIYHARGELLRQYTAETLRCSGWSCIAGRIPRWRSKPGEAVPASFTKRFYKGEETFTVTAGETTEADVKCTQAEHRRRSEIRRHGHRGFRRRTSASWIVADDAFDEGTSPSRTAVPALKYTSDATGYFTLPEGVTTFTIWHFEGTHSERGVRSSWRAGRRRHPGRRQVQRSPACSRRTCRGSSNASSSRSTPRPRRTRTTRSFSVPTPPSRATASTSSSPRATSPATTWTRNATNSRHDGAP